MGEHRVADRATSGVSVGALLRQLREAAGLTQAEVGKRLNCGQSRINKLESEGLRLRDDTREELMDLYDASEDERWQARLLSTVPSPRTKLRANFVRFLDYAPRSSEILAFHSERIPIPLQAQHYLLLQHKLAGDPRDMATLIALHDDRRHLLTGASPPQYRVIMGESSLRRMPGGRMTLAIDQTQELLSLGALDHVSVRILPYEANIPFLFSDFTVLRDVKGIKDSKTGKDKPFDAAFTESVTDARLSKDVKTVKEYLDAWRELTEAALNEAESAAFIKDVRDRAIKDLGK
jgi:transcriptional regulator with XRE-family HTH domain